MDISKIWTPQLGPQVMACICPADIVFFGGSRGGGKTDCALGRQVLGGIRYGYKWNGLFVRKNYKHFAELRRRIKELIRLGLPAELKGGDTQTNRLVFDNGAMVLLTAIERVDKLEFFQGQQFCVAKGTRILMADKTGKKIQDLQIGDMVATLEGPRKVTRVMPPREDDCVELSNQFGSQVHPVKHPIFSAYGWQSYASLMETYSRGTEWNNRELSTLPVVKIPAILSGRVIDLVSSEKGTPRQFYISPEFSTLCSSQCQMFRQNVFLSSLDQQLPPSHVWRNLDCLSAYLHDAQSCDDEYGQILYATQDWKSGCQIGSCSNDEHLPYYLVPYRDILPSQVYADKTYHDSERRLLDVQGNIPEYIRLDLPTYTHPYDGTRHRITEKNSCAACMIAPYGKSMVYDITVDKANHYISYDTGVVNKNTEISVEEACQFGFIEQMIEQFKGCMRSPHGIPCRMFLTGNPGGAGHAQVQARFNLGRIGLENGVKPGQFICDSSGETMVFIPSSVDDNKVLCDKDPKYVNRLKSIRDPMLRRAWLEGDWDVIMGGFFTDVWSSHNILPQFRIPSHWPRLIGFDFGSAKPFSIGWYAVASGEFVPELGMSLPRGALVRFYEWYGCVKDSPNTGLKLDSKKIAERMLVIEKQHNLLGIGASCDYIADPAIFKQEDGPSIADKMAEVGIVWRRGDNQRVPGWDSMRSAMRGNIIEMQQIDDPETMSVIARPVYEPMFYSTDNCANFNRIIPTLERDDHNFEDLDTSSEDHVADECFTGNTVVYTNLGPVFIGSLVGTSGLVLSCTGEYEKYCNCRLVGKNSRIIELTFSDGFKVRCTPDHLFLTNIGWVEAKDLHSEHRLVSVSQQGDMLSCKSSMEGCITNAGITGEVKTRKDESEHCSIGMFGRSIMGSSLLDTIFTTGTKILTIMRSKILNLLKGQNITDSIRSNRKELSRTERLLKLHRKVQKYGMTQKKESHGIESSTKISAEKPLKNQEPLSLSVANAERNSEELHRLGFVQGNAKQPGDERAVSITSKESVQSAVKNSQSINIQKQVHAQRPAEAKLQDYLALVSRKDAGRADVYCLEVPSTSCFCLANYLIVHNCRYVCMARPEAGPVEADTVQSSHPMAREFEMIESKEDQYDDMESPAESQFMYDDPLLDLARW